MKINKIFKGFALTLLTAAFATGCYEDEGNYDYADLRETHISGISSIYYRIMGQDTITINPVLWETVWAKDNTGTSTEADPADYTYEWLLLGGKVDGVSYNQYVVSTEPQLDKHLLNLAQGTHTFCLKATNRDGVGFYSDNFKVQVESQLGRGLLIMCNVNGSTRLDYLNHFNRKSTLITDIIGMVGSEAPLVGAPVAISCFYDHNSPKQGMPLEGIFDSYGIEILTETDAYALNPNDFSYSTDYDLRKQFVSKPGYNFRPNSFFVQITQIPTSISASVYDNGSKDIYWTMGMMQSFWSVDKIANASSLGRFNPSPIHFITIPNTMVLFNDDTKSFHSLNVMMAAMMPAMFKADAFNDPALNNLGKDLVFLHEHTNATAMNAILRDPATGKYTLMQFSSMGTGVASYAVDLLEADKIEEFGMRWNIATPFIYYRTDEKIYALNTNNLSSKLVYSTTDAGRKGGTKISKMKFVRNFVSETDYFWMDNLMVFTYDPALPEESCGTLEMYKSTGASGELEFVTFENQAMLFNGLGKVVDADFKQK